MRRRAAFDTITTPRLTLRPPRPEDAAALAASIGNYDVIRWLGTLPFPYDAEDAARFIDASAGYRGRRWLVFDHEGLVGGVGIDGELGYWIARPAWGKGYATEAAEVALDAYFADPGALPLTSCYFLGNDRSHKVLANLGFRPTQAIQRHSVPLRQTLAMQELAIGRADWQALRDYRLKTSRLSVRGVVPGQGRALHRILGHPDVAPMLSSVPLPWPLAEAENWAGWHRYRGRPAFLALIRNPWRRAVGVLTVAHDAQTGGVGIGCVIEPGHCDKGYGAEAVGAFVGDLFRRFDLPELSAAHFADNARSARVLAKLGFREVHRLPRFSAARLEEAENIHYRLSRSEWERAQ